MNLITKLFGREAQEKKQDGLVPEKRQIAQLARREPPRLEGNIVDYCDFYGVELFVGDEKSDFDICARMKSDSGEEFVIETVSKKEPYQVVSPYLGERFVSCNTIVTYPGKRNIYATGGNLHVSNGYAFSNGHRLVTGEMSGPKNWRHFDTGDNYAIPVHVVQRFKPAIDILEHLSGRTLLNEEYRKISPLNPTETGGNEK